jgi:hypothetical protein
MVSTDELYKQDKTTTHQLHWKFSVHGKDETVRWGEQVPVDLVSNFLGAMIKKELENALLGFFVSGGGWVGQLRQANLFIGSAVGFGVSGNILANVSESVAQLLPVKLPGSLGHRALRQ